MEETVIPEGSGFLIQNTHIKMVLLLGFFMITRLTWEECLSITDTWSNLSLFFNHNALTALQRESKATNNDKMALTPRSTLCKVCTFWGKNYCIQLCFHIKPQSHKKLCTDSIYRSLYSWHTIGLLNSGPMHFNSHIKNAHAPITATINVCA